ncbi:MFS transporter [Pseudonocardia sp. C8]|uniref:MFS transporter n=1 Tax=Pseudonocardia sp. C8 TaxID=2762759 RepID=UPI001642AE2B|nr:MFS transporter [Pseudonocardia sp. C8]MBC3194469.1 MFS transporter [Pseudonocardia sp. C8]
MPQGNRTDTDGGTPSRALAWTITGLLLVFMLINFADKAVLGLAAVQIMDELDLTAGEYGVVASSFFLLFSLAALVVGFVTNRVRTKWILIAMAVGWSAAQLPMMVPIAGFWTLLLTRVLLGAAEGPAYPVANHAAHSWFRDQDRDLASGVLTIGAPIGVILGAPVLGWIIGAHGWRTAFGVLGAVGLLWALVWAFVGREGPVTDTLGGSRATADDPAGSADDRLVPTWRILTTGTWLASVTGAFAAYWAVTILVAWVPPYLTRVLGYDAGRTGAVVVLPWAAGALSIIGVGLLAKLLLRRGVSSRWARGGLGGACVVTAGVAMLGIPLVDVDWARILLLTVAFSVGGVVIPIGQATSAEICPSSRRGGVLGTWAAVYSLSGIVAPALTGSFIGSAATPAAGFGVAFTVNGLLLVAAGLVFALFVRPGRDRARLAALTAHPQRTLRERKPA